MIYVKTRMTEMPTGCEVCELQGWDADGHTECVVCPMLNIYDSYERPEWCPLVIKRDS